MNGLELANQIVDPLKRQALAIVQKLQQEDQRLLGKADRKGAGLAPVVFEQVPVLGQVPQPPIMTACFANINLDEVWAYINPAMLYTRHPGTGGVGPKSCCEATKPSSCRNSSTSSRRSAGRGDAGPRRLAVLSRVQ